MEWRSHQNPRRAQERGMSRRGALQLQTRPARRAWPGSGSLPVPQVSILVLCCICIMEGSVVQVTVVTFLTQKANVRLAWSNWIPKGGKWQMILGSWINELPLLEELKIPNSYSYLSLLLLKLPWESHLASEGLGTSSMSGDSQGKGIPSEASKKILLRRAWV